MKLIIVANPEADAKHFGVFTPNMIAEDAAPLAAFITHQQAHAFIKGYMLARSTYKNPPVPFTDDVGTNAEEGPHTNEPPCERS